MRTLLPLSHLKHAVGEHAGVYECKYELVFYQSKGVL